MTKLKRSPNNTAQNAALKAESEAWIASIAAQITDFYKLFVRMQYLPEAVIAYPPHDIDDAMLKKYDFSDDVCLLIKSLPYVNRTSTQVSNWGFGASSGTEWMLDGVFMDLRCEETLAYSKNPMYYDIQDGKGMDEENGPYMHPEYLLLNDSGNEGMCMVLDTAERQLWMIDPNGGSSDFAITEEDEEDTPNTYTLKKTPCRPAVDVLRDHMRKFETLEWIPGGLYGDLKKVVKVKSNEGNELGQDESEAESDSDGEVEYELISSSRNHENYKRLYLEHGWPDNFDGNAFLKAQAAYEESEFEQRIAEDAYNQEACYLKWIGDEEKYGPRDRLAKLEEDILTDSYRQQFSNPEVWEAHYEQRKEELLKEIAETDERKARNEKHLAEAREAIRKMDPEVGRRRAERIAKWKY